MKQCPFCAYNRTKLALLEFSDHYEYKVQCLNCAAAGPNELSKAQAIKSWNMRRKVHPSAQVDVMAKSIREQIEGGGEAPW